MRRRPPTWTARVALIVMLRVLALPASTSAQNPLPSAPADASPSLSIDFSTRTPRQGEVVAVTVHAPSAVAAVQLDLFGRSTPAWSIGEGVWQLLAGVDLDQSPGSYTATIQATTSAEPLVVHEALNVTRGQFRTRVLKVAPDFVNPPPAVMVRIREEQAFTKSIDAASAADRLWSSSFVRPVPHPANSSFGSRSVFNGERRSPHTGTDFLSPAGTPVKAPNRGRVVAARDLYFTGNTVVLDHGMGLLSMLAHLSRIDVHEGEMVEPGQVVGLVGATGRVTGPHLHWALSMAGARVDPLSLLTVVGEK